MLSNIFFDLDGTLTDSKEGIIKCYQYALDKLNCTNQAEVLENNIIGPPLRVTFRRFLNTNDEALIENAVAIYRERFSTIGLFENQVYAGIPEMLSILYDNSFRLYIVTSKMKIYAERIIEHFQLATWFEGIYGAELEGRFDNKADLISHILSNNNLAKENTVMIGDRKEDISAGKANGIRTIGVTYGYGTRKEISDAAPDYICNNPLEIQKLLMGKC